VSTVEPSRFRIRDLINEAVAGALQRRGRYVLTVLGTALGVGALVAVVGLTTTVGGQISERFTVLAATEVTVEQVQPEGASAGTDLAFPEDADARMRAIRGVREAGVLWTVSGVEAVSAVPPTSLRKPANAGERTPVVAASAGALRAIRPHVADGVLYNEFHEARAERVAVVGAAVAQRLGLGRLDAQPAIFLDGVPLTVVGIIDEAHRRTDVLFAVLVPRRTAQQMWGTPDSTQRPVMLVDTDLGAAQVVGDQAALNLRPDAPELFLVMVPPDPRSLRDNVKTDINALLLTLAGICLVVGAVGIANTTLVAVLERVPEIGLRRAFGARPRHIALQFLAEGTALGTIGGLVGTSAGVVIVVVFAAIRHWTPILEPWAVIPAPVLGAVTGLLAALYPALRAARLEPADALRR
jgi:putative ABC transport system permease protein